MSSQIIQNCIASPMKSTKILRQRMMRDIFLARKLKNKSLTRYGHIPSCINEGITISLLQVKNSTHSLAQARLSAYARRPPEYAFLLMRACVCASFYGQNFKILYIFFNLLDILHPLSLVLAFNDNFDFFFFLLFLTHNLITS